MAATRPLRAYLLTLVVGVALPLVLLTALQAERAAQRQRAAVEAGLVESTRALAGAVERELLTTEAALQILAGSSRLAAGDLAGFREEAIAAARQARWSTVWLADDEGRLLVNAMSLPGVELPSIGDRPYFQALRRTGEPVVSGRVVGRLSGRPVVVVAVPAHGEGGRDLVLGANVSATVFDEILAPVDRQVRSATASVVDADFVLLARNRDAERFVGQRANDGYVAVVQRAPEGVSRTTTLEGDPVYVAFRRLSRSGWTIGMGVPAAQVEAPMQRSLWTAAAAGTGVLMLAGALAVLLSRRITAPMRQLADAAESIARGQPTDVPQASRILEVQALAGALRFAAEATRERNRFAEQTRQIAADLEAAEIRERQQIARDLHDDLAQTLSAVQIRLQRLKSHPDAAVGRCATELGDLVERANRSTRSLAEQLAPPVLYELGLLPALEWLAQQLHKDYGLEVDLVDDGRAKPLSPEAASIVFRCVRELLINVAKHARTHAASVQLDREQDVRGKGWLMIHVLDGGCGFEFEAPPAEAGRQRFGLMAVKERIAYLGGSLHLSSIPGDGTQALLSLPLKGEDAAGADAARSGLRSSASSSSSGPPVASPAPAPSSPASP